MWAVFALWPAAALTGASLSWPPGSAAGLMFAIPAIWVGARFPLAEAGLFAALAAFACATEATLLRVLRKAAAWLEIGVPGPADDRLLGPLAGLVVIGLVFRAVRDRPAGLTLAAPAAHPRDAAPDVLEGAVSLLSLQGLEGLPPAPDGAGAHDAAGDPRPADAAIESIRRTARACLRCDHVSVWLWDGRSLREAGGPSQANVRRPVPDPNRGLAEWVLRTRRPVARQTLGLWTPRDRSLAEALAEDPSPPAGIAPLLSGPGGAGTDPGGGDGAELHGLLIADHPRAGDPQFPAVLAVLARVAATALENAKRYDRVQGRARRDDLTGLLRRDPLLEDLSAMLAPTGDGGPIAVVMGDLDHFKSFNDTHGHPAGDAAIRLAADVWRERLPPGGRLCRYGGEEFLAALPGLSAGAAAAHAAAVGAAVRTRGIADDGRCLRATMSFGVAAVDAVDLFEADADAVGPLADRLIRRADAALFAAKEAGRDRVAVVDADGLLVDESAAAPRPLGRDWPDEPPPNARRATPEKPTLTVESRARVGADGRVRGVELVRAAG